MTSTRKHRRDLTYEIARLRGMQRFVDPTLDDASAKTLAMEIRDQAEVCLSLLDQYQSSMPGRMWSYSERSCQPLRQDLKRTAMQFRAASGEWELRKGERMWGQSWWGATDPGSDHDHVTQGDDGLDPLPMHTGIAHRHETSPSVLSDLALGGVVETARPSREDYESAARLGLLGLIAGQDLNAIMEGLAALHRRNDSFPAEVLLELAAEAIERSGVSLVDPMQYDELRDRHLPEYAFHGRSSQHKSRYALTAAAMMRAGVYPDLLEEAYWRGGEDMWEYAFYALVAYARAAAERTNQSLEEVAVAMAARRGLDLEVARDSSPPASSADNTERPEEPLPPEVLSTDRTGIASGSACRPGSPSADASEGNRPTAHV